MAAAPRPAGKAPAPPSGSKARYCSTHVGIRFRVDVLGDFDGGRRPTDVHGSTTAVLWDLVQRKHTDPFDLQLAGVR